MFGNWYSYLYTWVLQVLCVVCATLTNTLVFNTSSLMMAPRYLNCFTVSSCYLLVLTLSWLTLGCLSWVSSSQNWSSFCNWSWFCPNGLSFLSVLSHSLPTHQYHQQGKDLIWHIWQCWLVPECLPSRTLVIIFSWKMLKSVGDRRSQMMCETSHWQLLNKNCTFGFCIQLLHSILINVWTIYFLVVHIVSCHTC